jgi:aldose 1-epimerase
VIPLVRTICALSVALAMIAISPTVTVASTGSIQGKPWGSVDNHPITVYTLTNSRGAFVTITNYGGTVTSINVPDKRGKLGDVVLGYNSLAPYADNFGGTYFGALIGRYANRIAKGHLVVDGKTYSLFINNGVNTLHGGKVGYNKRVWTAIPLMTTLGPSLRLTYLSPAGEENYPGTVKINVIYTFLNSNALKIDYKATSDRDTVINLTNHSYFNLSGAGNGTILDEKMQINADSFTPTDSTAIPTGILEKVAGTPFDFRSPHVIGSRIDAPNQQLKFGHGYDHNFVLNRKSAGDLEFAARASDPKSGRVLEVYTTQPGIQLYSGNYLNGTEIGKGGKQYKKNYAFCLETQHFPDSPNEPSFPTTELSPGHTYHEVTVYRFPTP